MSGLNALDLALRATAPICGICDDLRVVAGKTREPQSCPSCGEMGEQAYGDWRRSEYGKRHATPEICQLDLTPEELELYRIWKDTTPGVSKLTLLSWIEGRRYDPSNDEELVELVRERVAACRAAMPPRDTPSSALANASRGELYRRYRDAA